MSNDSEQQGLWDEMAVDIGWFHVMRTTIKSNRIAEIGTTAWCVWCVIKAYADRETGSSFPSQETIAGHIGVNRRTVTRAVQTLIEAGMVKDTGTANRNMYNVIEALPLALKQSSVPKGTAELPYRANALQGLLRDIQEYAQTGRGPNSKEITVNLTVNIAQDGGVINNINNINNNVSGEGIVVQVLDSFGAAVRMPPEIRRRLRESGLLRENDGDIQDA